MPKRYRPGDIVYMLESNWLVREVRIVKVTGDFAIIRFRRDSGIRLRISRPVFGTKRDSPFSYQGREDETKRDCPSYYRVVV